MTKPYDKTARCEKCGDSRIGTRYCNGEYGQRAWNEVFHTGEAIHRHCQNCQYEWVEAPLSSAKVDSEIKRETK